MTETVVGYDYKAERQCDDCIRWAARAGAASAGSAMMWGDAGTTEDILGEWASMLGLDRDDEDSFDQSEFPKRVHEDQAHSDCTPINRCVDRCEGCGRPLGGTCPRLARQGLATMSDTEPAPSPTQPDVTVHTAAHVGDADLVERFTRALLVELGPGALVRLLPEGADEGTDFTIKAQDKPRCRSCGKTLRQEYTSVDENGQWNRAVRRPMWGQPGYAGNGRFCTKSCAARWAVCITGGDLRF
jgi:ribosomal protein L34E